LDDPQDLIETTARAIADGLIVGWFQGRMEWGPRALGNRSILGDPRRPDMKTILNLKIKRRESFRPFAPSVLREAVADWFIRDDDVPFMLQVIPIRPERRGANTRSDPRRWNRTPPDCRSHQQPALLLLNPGILSFDRCANGAQHIIQRKRAGRLSPE
jgi:predicted NodU family carbamoyl transferase